MKEKGQRGDAALREFELIVDQAASEEDGGVIDDERAVDVLDAKVAAIDAILKEEDKAETGFKHRRPHPSIPRCYPAGPWQAFKQQWLNGRWPFKRLCVGILKRWPVQMKHSYPPLPEGLHYILRKEEGIQ